MYHTLYRSLYHGILADRACEVGHKSLRPILGCSACVDAKVLARSPSVAILRTSSARRVATSD
jgi:hypothetical protein